MQFQYTCISMFLSVDAIMLLQQETCPHQLHIFLYELSAAVYSALTSRVHHSYPKCKDRLDTNIKMKCRLYIGTW